jgi:hypothetical protein
MGGRASPHFSPRRPRRTRTWQGWTERDGVDSGHAETTPNELITPRAGSGHEHRANGWPSCACGTPIDEPSATRPLSVWQSEMYFHQMPSFVPLILVLFHNEKPEIGRLRRPLRKCDQMFSHEVRRDDEDIGLSFALLKIDESIEDRFSSKVSCFGANSPLPAVLSRVFLGCEKCVGCGLHLNSHCLLSIGSPNHHVNRQPIAESL